MSRKFRTANYEDTLNQTIRLSDALPTNHLARYVVDIIGQLDLSQMYKRYAPRGGEAIAPEILLGLLFYGYASGVFSSRKIERATYESIPFRYVAGAVGLLICDIWAWFDGSQIDRSAAIQFGRGLQSVNILRNREEDGQRGVNFFPSGWAEKQMSDYARKNIEKAKAGIAHTSKDSFRNMVDIPLALAEATLQALENGQSKLTHSQVMQIVGQI